MKKITLIILVLIVLALATPANAARELPVVGDKISIFDNGNQEFTAEAPFYIMHGFGNIFGDLQAIGVFDFNLEIVGESVGNGLRYIQPYPGEDYGRVTRIYNFLEGMPEGVYTLIGRWYSPCQYAFDPSDCPQPNEPVLSRMSTVTITFTP